MPVISYTFATPANYNFDPTAVEVVNGSASLVLQSAGSQFLNEPINDDTGFTYDNTQVEFVGGEVRQLDVTPLASVFGVSYQGNVPAITNEADLAWHKNTGMLAAVVVGSPIIVNGALDCTGVGASVFYQHQSTVTETIKVKYTPNNSLPATNVDIITLVNGFNTADRIFLSHSPSGNTLRTGIYDTNNIAIIAGAFNIGSPNFISGQEYEIEIVIDSIGGFLYVFIDGLLFTTQNPGPWTRGTGLMRYYLGGGVYNICDGTFDDFIVFNDVQHTASYQLGYTIDPYIYVNSSVDLPLITKPGLGTFLSLTGIVDIANGPILYSLNVDGNGFMYWDGAAWVASDGSSAESNTLSVINANIATFPDTNGSTTISIRLHFSQSNTTQSSVDDITIIYNGHTLYPTTNPKINPLVGVSQHQLMSFLAVLTADGLDAVRFELRVGGQDMYFDGSNWVASDGSYLETNDLVTLQANLSSFAAKGTIVPVIHLHSDDGTTTPSIDNISLQYDFYAGATTPENVCTVWGYLYDAVNKPLIGTSVVVTPTIYGVINDKLISRTPQTVVTDADGYWEIKLIETESTSNNWAYKFELPGYTTTRIVPNKDSAQLNELGLSVL